MSMEPDLNLHSLKYWSADERVQAVKRIFRSITPHYDLLNRIMSGRRDVYWRRFSASRIQKDARSILDVATGTGDLAIDIALSLPHCQVVGLDFVPAMMDIAISKTAKKGLSTKISYVAGDATYLPFFDNCFDAVTIGFGLQQLLDRSEEVFSKGKPKQSGTCEKELHAKIGQLTMENDFLSVALGRIAEPGAKR